MPLVLGVLIAIALVATLVSFTLGLFAQRFIAKSGKLRKMAGTTLARLGSEV
jgi:hypothetical protein